MADIVSQNQEQQVKKLKRLLEGWRMALLPIRSIILWEQQWYPAAIVGVLSFLYFFIWLMDSNFLTTFAIVGIFLNFVDFIVPIICSSLYGPSSWTGEKEKVFEDICKAIVRDYNKILNQVHQFFSFRETSPILTYVHTSDYRGQFEGKYYIISMCLLCVLGWISSTINNALLLYILSVGLLLWPGIKHRGIFNMALSMVNMGPKPKSLKPE